MELDTSMILILIIGAIVVLAAIGAIMKIFWKVAGLVAIFALLAFVFTGATPRDLWSQADTISNGAGSKIKNELACPSDPAVLIQKISDQELRMAQLNQQLATVPPKSEDASHIRGRIVVVQSELKRLRFCQQRQAS